MTTTEIIGSIFLVYGVNLGLYKYYFKSKATRSLISFQSLIKKQLRFRQYTGRYNKLQLELLVGQNNQILGMNNFNQKTKIQTFEEQIKLITTNRVYYPNDSSFKSLRCIDQGQLNEFIKRYFKPTVNHQITLSFSSIEKVLRMDIAPIKIEFFKMPLIINDLQEEQIVYIENLDNKTIGYIFVIEEQNQLKYYKIYDHQKPIYFDFIENLVLHTFSTKQSIEEVYLNNQTIQKLLQDGSNIFQKFREIKATLSVDNMMNIVFYENVVYGTTSYTLKGQLVYEKLQSNIQLIFGSKNQIMNQLLN